MEKRTAQVGTKLSPDEYQEMLDITNEHAPSMTSAALLRLSWLYFKKVVERDGLLAVMSDIMGA